MGQFCRIVITLEESIVKWYELQTKLNWYSLSLLTAFDMCFLTTLQTTLKQYPLSFSTFVLRSLLEHFYADFLELCKELFGTFPVAVLSVLFHVSHFYLIISPIKKCWLHTAVSAWPIFLVAQRNLPENVSKNLSMTAKAFVQSKIFKKWL